jgi:Ribbon-helix-helix protein, copG family
MFLVPKNDGEQRDPKSCIHDLRGSADMTTGTVVTLKLNQQQLELIDRTVARGIAPDRAALVRLALREYAAAHLAKDAAREAKR